ncbi:hypothetical protein JCM1841_000247 [Sporobolomyces salmonicolor]
MSVMRDWQGIIAKLESDKVKERSEGIARCRNFLSSKRNLNALNGDRNHSWLTTLQTLFHVVILERNASVSKKSAATEKRLDEAAQLVRWLVEKVYLVIGRKAAKALVNHLTQMIAISGKLQAYALTYIKALRTVLNYPPHLEHLDERQWTDIVMLCFSAVLGDKIKIGQEFSDAEAMDVDEDETLGGSRRAGSDDERALPATTKRTANAVEIELIGCLEVVFRSKSSPFLTYAQAIFRKFLRFFRLFPLETTAHLAVLVALNRAFAELDLNDQRSMRRLGPHLWPHVLHLWSTKNASLKEQVVIALRYLFPFVVPHRHPNRSTTEPAVTARAKELYEAVLTEPTIRWRDAFVLDLDHFRLGVEKDGFEGERRAFEGKTFRIGSGFDEKQAVAWSVVELGADALATIYEVSEAVDGADVAPSETARGKRRKIEDPLSTLLDSLTDPTQPISVTMFRIQLLLFLVDRHWMSLDPEACQHIFNALIPLLSHVDPRVERWAFLAVAAIAAIANSGLPNDENQGERLSPSRRSHNVKSPSEQWDQVWLLALRKLSIVEVCRSAAHTANVLLAFNRVSAFPLADSIEHLAKDLDVQGPNFPSDAVCFFLEWCLALSASDARLFRLRLPDKVLNWVTTTWKPLDGIVRAHAFGQTRPHADPLSTSGLVSLLARLTDLKDVPKLPYDFFVPDCAVATQAIELGETAKVRDFIEARVPPYVKDDSGRHSSVRTPAYFDAMRGVQEDLEKAMQRKISGWMGKTLEGFQAEAERMGEAYWSAMSCDSARRHLDIACMALVVEGMFSLEAPRPATPAVRAANAILTELAPTLGLKKWQPAERAYLLGGLCLIFVPVEDRPNVEYPVLLDPGPASGIPRHLRPQREATNHTANLDSREFDVLRMIWKADSTRHALNELLSALRSILGELTQTNNISSESSTSASSTPMSQAPSIQASQRLKELEQTQKADDFGEIKVASRSTQVLGPLTAHRAGMACMSVCVRGFISSEMANSGSTAPVRLQEIVDAIVASEGEDGIIIAEQAFQASRNGLVTFGLAQAEAILEHLGNDLLPVYRYARDERFALVALRFLECTAGLWIPAEEAAEDFGVDARQLCAWYVNGLRRRIFASWRIRLQLTAFFDLYLSIDPTQNRWDIGGQSVRAENGKLLAPTAVIPFMLADADFRVRFRASSSAAKLFDLFHSLHLPEAQLFHDIRDNMNYNLTETEQVLTQILANANIMIVSAARRRAPYDHLLEIAVKNGELAGPVVAALTGVSERLGFATRAELYLEYARYVVWIQLPRGEDLAALPPGLQVGGDLGQHLSFRAAGFPTLRDARKADFNQTASWLLQSEHTQEAFHTMCDVLRRSPREGRLACFPQTVACIITRHQVELHHKPGIPVAVIRTKLAELAEAAGAGDAYMQEALISSMADEIVVETLLLTFPFEGRLDEVPRALAHDKRAAETFIQLIQLPVIFDTEPPPPHHWPDQTVAGILMFDKDFPVLSQPAAVFSVVYNLLGRVYSARFVVEQQRRLLHLALLVSLSHRVVRDPPILAALVDGLIGLLPQLDLVVFVPSMLRWCLTEWLAHAVTTQDEEKAALCEQLARAAHATEWLREALGGSNAGTDSLAAFLDDALRQLCALQEPTTMEACLLWPRKIVATQEFGCKDVYEALASPFAPSGKFGFVHELQNRHDILSSPLGGRIVWRLMQAISSTDDPSPDDCLAFADILYAVGGDVETPDLVELSEGLSGDEAFEPPMQEDNAIKRAVLRRVIRLLSNSDRKLVSAAFETAKAIFSVPESGDVLKVDEFSFRLRPVVSFLAHPSLMRPERVRPRLVRSLDELGTDAWIKGGRDFSRWVREFAELLADVRASSDMFYAQLVGLIQISPPFAQAIIPHLVHSILLQGYGSGDFEAGQKLSRYLEQLLRSRASSKEAIAVVVDTVTYLRRHPRTDLNPASTSRFDTWLAVPWVLVADGAVKTGAYLAGLLFLELAHEYSDLFQQRDGRMRDRRSDEKGQALLYEIYSKIDEPDGFYGQQSDDVRQALIRRYCHEGRWTDAFETYGARHEAQSRQLGTLDSSATAGVVTSLASLGFHRLAMSVFQPARLDGSLQEDDLAPDLPYELAWRTDVWDLPIGRYAAGTSSVSLYTALRASRPGRSLESAREAVRSSLVVETRKLASVSLDLPRPSTDVVSTIIALREVARLVELKEGDKLAEGVAKELSLVPPDFSLNQAERVLSTRVSRLRALRAQDRVEQVGDAFTSSFYASVAAAERACLVQLSKSARQGGQLQAALNAITLAHTLVDDPKITEVDHELAHVLWAQGEHTTAVSLLNKVHQCTGKHDPMLWATLGEWTGEAHLRNPRQVLEECFEPAIQAFQRATQPKDRARVYQSFAAFADAQYQDLAKWTAEKRARYAAYARRKEVEFMEIDRQMRSTSSGSHSSGQLERSRKTGEAHLEDDRRQLEEAEQTTNSMLWRALENYARALTDSDDHDDQVFRFCALWLAHADDDDLHARLKPLLTVIPSHKFVFLAYQLSARLSETSSQPSHFAKNIRRLVFRLVTDHPFHAFFPVYALCEAAPPVKASRRSSTVREAVPKNPRAYAALDIIDQVKKSAQLRARIESLELACESYGEWAGFDVKNHAQYQDSRGRFRSGALPIVRSMKLKTKLVNLPIPVSTYDLPIDPTGRYDDATFPHLVKYDDNFDTAGGIHTPKIVTCRGSDGKAYKQLVKGDDDIRQDAVMEQVFTLVNNLLEQDAETRRRKLRIRTYKVIPLQNRNGLLEFVANTAPLGTCLSRLYDQMQPGQRSRARDTLGEIERRHRHRQDARDAEKDAAFKKLLVDFQPLMRYLFWQRHKVPSLWFDMRLNYSRSVATTSIIGFVVGLGDRHVSNILMDEARGELVHIDFGIAFDQGKRLPIPELVPFRLTQNLIDGFGMSGVDGIFRRCAEETLRVLRQRSNILMTVLEVFKHDPLQTWAVSSEMAKRVQGSDEGDGLDELPDDADRALSIVASKLDTRLSVQYTVNQLIQEATDLRNLARIFSGWQPYL